MLSVGLSVRSSESVCLSVRQSVLVFLIFQMRGFECNIATCLIWPSLHFLIQFSKRIRWGKSSKTKPTFLDSLFQEVCMYWFKTMSVGDTFLTMQNLFLEESTSLPKLHIDGGNLYEKSRGRPRITHLMKNKPE